MQEKFYITTAIAYASRKPHIGNMYEIIFTDAIARYNKMLGKDVFFLTGTDEHGQKIENLAVEAGISPKEYVDTISSEIKKMWNLMDIDYSHFIRTTDNYHEEAVKKIFKKLYDQGDIYLGEYKGWYCTPCEAFYTETQLVDGKCPDCGREVYQAKEEAYFLKCSKYQDKLIEYIESHPGFIEPESRKKEIMNNFLKAGLQDLCVSRTSFKWGIPVEFNPGHVVYVWIDALSNYITALGYNVDEKSDKYNKYWPADLHVIGKDILRFHSIYWSILLMALGEPLPKKIYAHGWMLFGNDKMSKSKGNVIYPDELAKDIGVDAVRYYCLSEMNYSEDGSITYESVLARYNSDLANTIGNLVNRTVTMVNKYFDGTVLAPEVSTEFDEDLIKIVTENVKKYNSSMSQYRLSEAISDTLEIARRSNKYIDETSPWVLAKTEEGKAKLKTVLYNLIECIKTIATLLAPIMPDTSKKIAKEIGYDSLELAETDKFGSYKSGTRVTEAVPLFARLDETKMLEEYNRKMAENKVAVKEETKKEELISIDDVDKVKLKVAKILSVGRIPDAKKLYKLEVDLGTEVRTVVSGLVPYYKEEELIGKKVVLVSNLKPAVLKGVQSNGMLLAAGDGDIVKVLFVDDEIGCGESIH